MAEIFKISSQKKYANMRARFMPKMSPTTGRLRVPGRELPFTLADFRAWLYSQSDGCVNGIPVVPPHAHLVFRCAYCTRALYLDHVEIDHVDPVKRGGSLGLNNLAIACKQCNQRKGELTAAEYRALLSGLETFPQAARAYILRCLSTAAMGARLRFHPREQKGGGNGNEQD